MAFTITNNETPAYVYNLSNPNYSEVGMILIKKRFGEINQTSQKALFYAVLYLNQSIS